jgi:hemolysin III
MSPPVEDRPRSPLCESHAEEMASMATHAVGTVLAIAAFVMMVLAAEGEVFKTISASVFGGSLVLLYLSSTIYHATSCPRRKPWLQALDHACIYLLIAGSYTPLSLVALRGPWGWSLFGVVWFLALAGVLLKTLGRGKRTSWWSTGLYIFMGWLAVFALGPMIRALPMEGIAWLVAGGLCYTFGVIFFAWEKLPFNHAIWHLFVLAGSFCHVMATMLYILK